MSAFAACKFSSSILTLGFSLKSISEEKKEANDDMGVIFEAHQQIRDLLSELNDSVKGRCNICFEDFCLSEKQQDEAFTDRVDLIRIGECYHKFHLLCLWRFWFMPRHRDMDKFFLLCTDWQQGGAELMMMALRYFTMQTFDTGG